MQFKILGTGSSGNCFLINDDLMIDAGLPYSKIKDKVKNVRYVLLTHIHGDHFNKSTIRKLAANHNVMFICGEWLFDELLNIVNSESILVYGFGIAFDAIGYDVAMVKAYHDVPNCGYRIMQDGHKHLHITDTYTLDGIAAKGYHSASIECNHEINKALVLIDEAKENGEFSHLIGAVNSHLSVDKTIQFCKGNGIKKLIPVHIGSSTKKEVIDALKRW
ncbi:MAG: MBL fold metallo-hydrolase [Gammaproteobacteria bacterium]|nr:MBL fold metallo-hydrolase [Gammaproteobacteria bacterium]